LAAPPPAPDRSDLASGAAGGQASTLTQNAEGINVESSDNRIHGNSMDNHNIGVRVEAPDNRLTANHIDGGTTGIWLNSELSGGAGDADSTTVIANVVTGQRNAGILVSADENAIRANQLSGNAVGILVETGAEANALTGNRAEGNTGSDLLDGNPGCDDNKWRGNTFDTAFPEDCID
jgi:parallel beta-helix repeat protein